MRLVHYTKTKLILELNEELRWLKHILFSTFHSKEQLVTQNNNNGTKFILDLLEHFVLYPSTRYN
jgi:hypothetical protein